MGLNVEPEHRWDRISIGVNVAHKIAKSRYAVKVTVGNGARKLFLVLVPDSIFETTDEILAGYSRFAVLSDDQR